MEDHFFVRKARSCSNIPIHGCGHLLREVTRYIYIGTCQNIDEDHTKAIFWCIISSATEEFHSATEEFHTTFLLGIRSVKSASLTTVDVTIPKKPSALQRLRRTYSGSQYEGVRGGTKWRNVFYSQPCNKATERSRTRCSLPIPLRIESHGLFLSACSTIHKPHSFAHYSYTSHPVKPLFQKLGPYLPSAPLLPRGPPVDNCDQKGQYHSVPMTPPFHVRSPYVGTALTVADSAILFCGGSFYLGHRGATKAAWIFPVARNGYVASEHVSTDCHDLNSLPTVGPPRKPPIKTRFSSSFCCFQARSRLLLLLVVVGGGRQCSYLLTVLRVKP